MKVKIVGIVNYGVGNLRSVARAVQHVGGNPKVTFLHDELMQCDQLILPGVGAYSQAMRELKKLDLDKTVCSFASSGKPILGICLGMQMLGLSSTEFSYTEGLALCDFKVSRLDNFSKIKKFRLPHVAWKSIESEEFKSHWLLKGIKQKDKFYFIHSFAVNSSENHILALSEYCDIKFASIIENQNVLGTQFHPEKSGSNGLNMLCNFVNR